MTRGNRLLVLIGQKKRLGSQYEITVRRGAIRGSCPD